MTLTFLAFRWFHRFIPLWMMCVTPGAESHNSIIIWFIMMDIFGLCRVMDPGSTEVMTLLPTEILYQAMISQVNWFHTQKVRTVLIGVNLVTLQARLILVLGGLPGDFGCMIITYLH